MPPGGRARGRALLEPETDVDGLLGRLTVEAALGDRRDGGPAPRTT